MMTMSPVTTAEPVAERRTLAGVGLAQQREAELALQTIENVT